MTSIDNPCDTCYSNMNYTDEQLKRRFKELADKAYSRNICTFTNFLGLLELNTFYETAKDLSFAVYHLYGGADFCDRQVVRFGTSEMPYPIDCLHVTPSLKKFSDALTHRDFLGAMINLGIKREMLGDIIVRDNEAFVFCIHTISDFIIQNLDRVKHTTVKCSLSEEIPDQSYITIVRREFNVASLRLDAIVGEICKLSRSQAQTTLREKKVFINGRLTENNSYHVKPEDTITVRGFGKFILTDDIRATKKGRFFITVQLYSDSYR